MEREDNSSIPGMSHERLASLSPAELEEIRRREVQNVIDQAPERIRRRLQGLQFEIDAKRRLHKSPLGSCICISQMMQESLERLNAALQGKPLPEQHGPAEILPFPRAGRLRQNHQDRPGV